jgi:hypothetical protein
MTFVLGENQTQETKRFELTKSKLHGTTVQLAFCELKAFCFLGLVFAQNKCHF